MKDTLPEEGGVFSFDIILFMLYNIFCASAISSMDRVTHYECAGLGFESLMARHLGKAGKSPAFICI